MGTVLMVDDDKGLVEAYRLVVTQHGHEVVAAYSAEEARQLLERDQPDVIVLDVMMERMDSGFDLAREINQKYPKLPVLMLTSVNQVVPASMHFEPEETWLPVGKFIEKPVEPDVLVEEINGLLTA
jgi:CheY-like chemotaxis protein